MNSKTMNGSRVLVEQTSSNINLVPTRSLGIDVETMKLSLLILVSASYASQKCCTEVSKTIDGKFCQRWDRSKYNLQSFK